MKTIAKACGVSPMTVSRALRSGVSVASQTQRRIRAMAEKSGYQINGCFGRPRRPPSVAGQPIEIVIGTTIGEGNLYHTRLVLAIEHELSRHKCDCLIRSCGADYDQFVLLCEALRRTKPLNLLIIGYFPTDRLQGLLNLVPNSILVDQTGHAGLTGPYEWISFDNVEAARLATHYLLDRGRRRILLIKGPVDHYFSRDIEQGFRETHKVRQQALDEALIVETDFTPEGARQAVAAVRVADISFDAVFTNDEMAMGVLRALHEAKLSIPRQVAVVGCDGLPISAHTMPSLTTIEMNYQRLAQMTVEHFFARRRAATPPLRIQLVPKLLVRESTGGRRMDDRRQTPDTGRRRTDVG